jgi:hypothetical protein
VKSPREKVAKALEGDYGLEHLFTLKQSLDGYRYYQKLIAELDREIQRLMQTRPSAVETVQEIPRRTKHSAFQRQGNDPGSTPASTFEANSIASLASILPIFPGSARSRHKSS